MRIGGRAWYLWIRKHFPFLRPRSEFKKGQWVDYGGPVLVIDPRIDHCGQIGIRFFDGTELWVEPYKLQTLSESLFDWESNCVRNPKIGEGRK